MDQVVEFAPVLLADSLKDSLVTKRDKKERSALGQYMTPPVISQFMASLFQDLSGNQIRLLDPGSGMGTLSASVCREILTRGEKPTEVLIRSFEIDTEFSSAQEEVLRTCMDELKARGVEGSIDISNRDFILHMSDLIGNDMFMEPADSPTFTHVVMNPPYKKIRQDSAHRKQLRQIGIETSNLYSAFLAIAILLLEDQGELVAIVPRSFCQERAWSSPIWYAPEG